MIDNICKDDFFGCNITMDVLLLYYPFNLLKGKTYKTFNIACKFHDIHS